MKLIKHTYLKTFLWLIPILLIGSIFSFYMIKYIVYEETDEHLCYEMERLITYHSKHNDLPEYHKVENIIEGIKIDKAFFKDTLILEEHDNEMIPHRELHFSMKHEGKDFAIVLRQLLPGNDDIIEGTLFMMLGLFLLISLFLFLVVSLISKKIWTPFYKTLSILSKYKITEPIPNLAKSNIEEFNTLNRNIEDLLKKITYDYQRTKEFNENASHELQTHLTIIRHNAEQLINSNECDNKSSEQLQTIINATSKLSQAQKSLLLLSKIGNLEYNKNINLNISQTINNSLELFHEAITIREIKMLSSIGNCILYIDAGLAEILINNLLKNAVKHNLQNGHISINLNQNKLIIENTGIAITDNPQSLFNRFAIGVNGNIGLGLAIVKQICEVYNYDISYNIEAEIHKIQINFTKT